MKFPRGGRGCDFTSFFTPEWRITHHHDHQIKNKLYFRDPHDLANIGTNFQSLEPVHCRVLKNPCKILSFSAEPARTQFDWLLVTEDTRTVVDCTAFFGYHGFLVSKCTSFISERTTGKGLLLLRVHLSGSTLSTAKPQTAKHQCWKPRLADGSRWIAAKWTLL